MIQTIKTTYKPIEAMKIMTIRAQRRKSIKEYIALLKPKKKLHTSMGKTDRLYINAPAAIPINTNFRIRSLLFPGTTTQI